MCLYLKLIFATASVWLSRTFIILAIMITPFWIILAQFKNVEEGEMPKLKTGRELLRGHNGCPIKSNRKSISLK